MLVYIKCFTCLKLCLFFVFPDVLHVLKSLSRFRIYKSFNFLSDPGEALLDQTFKVGINFEMPFIFIALLKEFHESSTVLVSLFKITSEAKSEKILSNAINQLFYTRVYIFLGF